MRFGKPPPGQKTPARPPVRVGGQKTSQAQTVLDDGQTRGAGAAQPLLRGRVGKALGTTGKGPPPSPRPPAKVGTPRGPGAGMLPGIAGPGMGPGLLGPAAPRPRFAAPILAIGQRPQLGGRTLAAMKKARPRVR